MLKIISVFAASDGQTFKTQDEAKAHEISLIACTDLPKSWGKERNPEDVVKEAGQWVVSHSAQIIAILTDKPVANPRKPRKDKGTTRVKPLPEAA